MVSIKLINSDKEKIIKAARGKGNVRYKRTKMVLVGNITSERTEEQHL